MRNVNSSSDKDLPRPSESRKLFGFFSPFPSSPPLPFPTSAAHDLNTSFKRFIFCLSAFLLVVLARGGREAGSRLGCVLLPLVSPT